MTDRNKCYCSAREKVPDLYTKLGIPEGFCGLCDIYKRPGHSCHVPAPLPYTGSWCVEHYQLIKDAFAPNFEENKTKLYFKTSFISPKTSQPKIVFTEFVGEMPFRFIISEQNKLTRYKHGDIKAAIGDWLIPRLYWGDPLEEITGDEFGNKWEISEDS